MKTCSYRSIASSYALSHEIKEKDRTKREGGESIGANESNRKQKRRKWLWWLLLLAVLAGGLGYYFYQSKKVPLISADLLPESGDATDQRFLNERRRLRMRIISRCKSIQKPFLMVKAQDPSRSSIRAPMYPIAVISLYCRAEVIYSSGAIYQTIC